MNNTELRQLTEAMQHTNTIVDSCRKLQTLPQKRQADELYEAIVSASNKIAVVLPCMNKCIGDQFNQCLRLAIYQSQCFEAIIAEGATGNRLRNSVRWMQNIVGVSTWFTVPLNDIMDQLTLV